jgi:hypothetical protein
LANPRIPRPLLEACARQGMSAVEVSRVCTCPESTVRENAKRHGIELRRIGAVPFSPADLADIRDAILLTEDSLASIARPFGATAAGVLLAARRMGLPTSRAARAHAREIAA